MSEAGWRAAEEEGFGVSPGGLGVVGRWMTLLDSHGMSKEDTTIIYALRNSLLHGYGLPKPEKADNREILLTGDLAGLTVVTETKGIARLSCSHRRAHPSLSSPVVDIKELDQSGRAPLAGGDC